jgi:hypothetical protein
MPAFLFAGMFIHRRASYVSEAASSYPVPDG